MEALQVKVLQTFQQLSGINAYVTQFSILGPTSDVTPLINSFLPLSFTCAQPHGVHSHQ